MSLCKCGCGEPVVMKLYRIKRHMQAPAFIRGHQMKGNNNPMYGKKQSEEAKSKIAASITGRYIGSSNPFYGRHHTQENKDRQSLLRREQYANGNNPFAGRYHTPEVKDIISRKAIERSASTEYRNMISATTKKAMTPEIIAVVTKNNKVRCSDPIWRKKKSEMETHRWKTDNDFIKRMRAARNAKPNKSEIKLLEILNSMYPNEWIFTGDFSVIINGKNPDFMNCNGKKLIIELFGEYWHKGETEESRAKVFSPLGYRTLVIWWKELKHIESLKVKIGGFVNEHI
jgi:very-short-patch-repair endonuclease